MQNYPPQQQQGAPNYQPSGMPQAPPPKSKKPWIIGGLIGCFLLIIILLLALGGIGYFVSKNIQSTQNANVPAATQGANTKQYVNSRAGRSGNLSTNYVDFSFYYPGTWELDPDPAPNFVKVERAITQGGSGEITQENFAVGWVGATGTALDKQLLPQLAAQLNSQFAAQFPNYQKVSEGEAQAGSYNSYEFRFTAKANDVVFWGRVALLAPPSGQTKGVALVMLATDRAPGLSGVEDVGERGELPIILNSFRFGTGTSK